MHWNQSNVLAVDDEATMSTSLDDAQEKHGRMGLSAMVWIKKDISNEKGFSMQENRCLVYHPPQPHHQEAAVGRGIKGKPKRTMRSK
jgi:3-methylfumaryl-CoA hydratase